LRHAGLGRARPGRLFGQVGLDAVRAVEPGQAEPEAAHALRNLGQTGEGGCGGPQRTLGAQPLWERAQQQRFALDARAHLRFERQRVRDQLEALQLQVGALVGAQPRQHHGHERERQQQRQRPQPAPQCRARRQRRGGVAG